MLKRNIKTSRQDAGSTSKRLSEKLQQTRKYQEKILITK